MARKSSSDGRRIKGDFVACLSWRAKILFAFLFRPRFPVLINGRSSLCFLQSIFLTDCLFRCCCCCCYYSTNIYMQFQFFVRHSLAPECFVYARSFFKLVVIPLANNENVVSESALAAQLELKKKRSRRRCRLDLASVSFASLGLACLHFLNGFVLQNSVNARTRPLARPYCNIICKSTSAFLFKFILF